MMLGLKNVSVFQKLTCAHHERRISTDDGAQTAKFSFRNHYSLYDKILPSCSPKAPNEYDGTCNTIPHPNLFLYLLCVCVCVQRSEEAACPFPLHPCLVCPDSEMAFLRCVARILLLCLLPQKDAKSHTLRCCLTEVITTKGADVLLRFYELCFISFLSDLFIGIEQTRK